MLHTSSKTTNDSSNSKKKRDSKEDTNDDSRGRGNKQINKQVQERITEKDKINTENKKFTAGSEIAQMSHKQQPRSNNEHQSKMTTIKQELRKDKKVKIAK